MLDKNKLRELIHLDDLRRIDQICMCLAVDAACAKSTREIRELLIHSGIPKATKWNISQSLGNSKGLAMKIPDGWSLTSRGKEHVYNLVGEHIASPRKTRVATNLREHLTQIGDAVVSDFVQEAINCYEADLFRAAVVLSWVGAVSVLQKYVVQNHLQDFNNEAPRHDPKWKKPATTEDDLGRMQERKFLETLAAISVIGKNVKAELINCLDFRNSCGHPNSLQIGEARVSAHIEILIDNVFSKFPV